MFTCTEQILVAPATKRGVLTIVSDIGAVMPASFALIVRTGMDIDVQWARALI